ncbi:MAG: ABC transporter permease [Vicinamibacterales bacterium]
MLPDLRFALHLIVKDRWYSVIAVAALALGIGVNAAVFTLVDGALIRGLPFKDSSRLLMLGSPRQPVNPDASPEVSYPDLLDWRAASRAFSGIAGFEPANVNVSDARSAAQQARATIVTANTFSLLGQQPLVGRDFTDADGRRGAAPVTILGYTLWQTRYNGDSSIVGQAMKINGISTTIVGVMPRDMMFPSNSELWEPFVPDGGGDSRGARLLDAFGRLSGGTTVAQAETEMNAIAERLSRAYPATNRNFPIVTIETFNDRYMGGGAREIFLSMMGAVAFLLLIACANVANLLLSRSAQRAREIAIRIALGATRWRIMRQLLIESVLLGIFGGVIGLGLAAAAVHLFDVAVQNTGKPYWVVFTMDYRVFGFLATVCVGTGLLFGLAPALHVSRTNVNEILKEGGRGNAGGRRVRWMSNLMVVIELACTLVLLVGAGLMVRSFLEVYHLDLGIRTDHLLTMRLILPDGKYPARPTAVGGGTDPRLVFYDRLLPAIAATPGVEAVAVTTSVPPFASGRRGTQIEGEAVRGPGEQAPLVGVVTISPAFFEAVGVQLQRGRGFTAADGTPGSDTIIVNEQLADRLFPGVDPIGHRMRFVSSAAGAAPDAWRTIIAISPNLLHAGTQNPEPMPVAYVPIRRDPVRAVSLLVRSRQDPASLVTAVRREVQSIDQDEPVFAIETMDQLLSQARWPYRVFGVVFGVFAAIALVMSALGLYAVLAYAVTQQTAEIGVRMALGARPRNISWLIVRRALVQLAIGLPLGLAGAFALSRALGALLVQISPTDPLTFAGISIVLVMVAMIACLIPVRRATRVDPLIALRSE